MSLEKGNVGGGTKKNRFLMSRLCSVREDRPNADWFCSQSSVLYMHSFYYYHVYTVLFLVVRSILEDVYQK